MFKLLLVLVYEINKAQIREVFYMKNKNNIILVCLGIVLVSFITGSRYGAGANHSKEYVSLKQQFNLKDHLNINMQIDWKESADLKDRFESFKDQLNFKDLVDLKSIF